jgi:ADP-ribose pyrophosphatase
MKKWKKISEKLLLSHPRLTIYEDTVELPNGHKTDYVRYGNDHDASCVLAINDQGKFLIQKEYSYPPDEWLYQLPGGALNKNEPPMQGAAREFAEEAGLKGDLSPLGWYYIDNRRRKAKFYVFLAQNLSETSAQHDIEEVFEDYWFTEKEVDQMIARGEITNYSLLCAWAIFKAKRSPKGFGPST